MEKLQELGLSARVARRIEAVVARRNRLVHHFMEEPEVLIALTTERGVDQLVLQVDSLAIECQQLVNIIAPDSFSGLLRTLGMNISQPVDFIQSVDVGSIEDQKLRDQFELIRGLNLEQLKQLFTDTSPD